MANTGVAIRGIRNNMEIYMSGFYMAIDTLMFYYLPLLT
jgi:hypothetical protein